MIASPSLQLFAVITLFVGGQEDRNEFVSALANLATDLFETHVVVEVDPRVLPCERVEIDRIQKRAV
jgi:hypothetical protein